MEEKEKEEEAQKRRDKDKTWKMENRAASLFSWPGRRQGKGRKSKLPSDSKESSSFFSSL